MNAPEDFLDGRVVLHCGDSRDVLRALPDASVHAVVTDPPYALVSIRKRFGAPDAAPAKDYSGEKPGATGAYARASAGFMGQAWDTGETAFAVEFWREVMRVLKPGGHVVAFGGTRSFHRLSCAIEDAGFELRDTTLELMSLDPVVRDFIASLSDTQLSAFLRVMDLLGLEGMLAWVYGSGFPKGVPLGKHVDAVLGIDWFDETERARGEVSHAHAHLDGFDVALKPAWEPIILARKPLDGTVAETVLAHGTGALNIDGCRVEAESWPASGDHRGGASQVAYGYGLNNPGRSSSHALGRWPANVVHDGSPEVVDTFPDSTGQSGAVTGKEPSSHDRYILSGLHGDGGTRRPRGDSGSAARFFYSAKADGDDRLGSKHPTVKPIALMQWLVRLVTPPGGVVLDPFAGSGTTGEAAWREGFSAILIEREPQYQADIRRRMKLALGGPDERKCEAIKARHGDVDAGPLFSKVGAAE